MDGFIRENPIAMDDLGGTIIFRNTHMIFLGFPTAQLIFFMFTASGHVTRGRWTQMDRKG